MLIFTYRYFDIFTYQYSCIHIHIFKYPYIQIIIFGSLWSDIVFKRIFRHSNIYSNIQKIYSQRGIFRSFRSDIQKYSPKKYSPPPLGKAKATPSWTLPESYGLMLAKLFQGTEAKTFQMLALYRVQAYCSTLDFPKGLIEKVFMNLYEHDIVDEDAFIAYKYDLTDDDETPGKMKAIIQLTNWLEWLEHAKEEEEEEDSDLDEEDEAEYMEQAPILL